MASLIAASVPLVHCLLVTRDRYGCAPRLRSDRGIGTRRDIKMRRRSFSMEAGDVSAQRSGIGPVERRQRIPRKLHHATGGRRGVAPREGERPAMRAAQHCDAAHLALEFALPLTDWTGFSHSWTSTRRAEATRASQRVTSVSSAASATRDHSLVSSSRRSWWHTNFVYSSMLTR